MTQRKAKRFWTSAEVVKVGGGFTIHLDARPLRTPAKAALVVPTPGLANAVAAEWQAQKDVIDPLSMPFTRAANAAIDKVSVQFEEVASLIADYGDSDLICYRAAHPLGLVDRQAVAWDPLIAWADQTLGAPLTPVTGIVPVAQHPDSLAQLDSAVRKSGVFGLTALHDLVALSGSLVIGLAAAHRAFSIGDLWDWSQVDENWQIEAWGVDDEAQKLTESRRLAFLRAHEFAHLVGDS